MRPLEETVKAVRDLQANCLERGFYQGRTYQAKSARGGATPAPTEAAAWKAKADESYAEATDLLAAIKDDLETLHGLVAEVGGDLL